jgi:hypothetical protein
MNMAVTRYSVSKVLYLNLCGAMHQHTVTLSHHMQGLPTLNRSPTCMHDSEYVQMQVFTAPTSALSC